MLLTVPETVEQVLHLYARKLDSRNIQIDTQYDTGVNIHGFVGELRQLFSNLVLNAVDAMAEGGRLRIHVRRVPERPDGTRSGVRITIADTGSGIPPKDMPRLFEPFFTTKEEFGTGLGLWISHGIVQKHGGRIRVRSRTLPGHSGTVFSVYLPEVVEAVMVA